jgi:glutamine synthetase
MADRYVFFRWMAGEITRRHGYFATFMPKPFTERAGSGAHYNISLWDKAGETNLFAGNDDPRGGNLSKLGYHFTAGLLKHLPALNAMIAPTVNSYKRLILKGSRSGFTWAPVYVCYGNNNRTNTVRIPLPGKRVEIRSADSTCNPYLGIAMALAAGLDGIENELDPGAPHLDNMYEKSEAELEAEGVRWLPRSLDEALDALDADPLGRKVMGDAMYDSWMSYKRDEWKSYLNHVSDWEKERYLKFF